VSPNSILLLQRMLCGFVDDRYELHEITDHNYIKEPKKDLTTLLDLKNSSWSQYFDKEGRFVLSKVDMIGAGPSFIKKSW